MSLTLEAPWGSNQGWMPPDNYFTTEHRPLERRAEHIHINITTQTIYFCFHQELGTFVGLSMFPPQEPVSKLSSGDIFLPPKMSMLEE